MKFGSQFKMNTVNSMIMFIFSILDQKYPFGQIELKKSKLPV